VALAEPKGEIGRPAGLRTKWANIGGREPGDCGDTPCLFRWFWDGGAADASVKVVGTQSNLNADDAAGCGTDSTCDVQNGIDGWRGVALASVHVAGPSSSGNVTVNLDATTSQDGGAAWSAPIGCNGGTIGLGGPGEVADSARSYRGDATYYATTSGSVSMRKSICASGYSARTFKTAVMHELGHVIGLHHPDQYESIHSVTSPSDWNAAVMRSSIAQTKPEAPQTDDIAGIQYLYGTAATGAMPAADFTFSPATAAAGTPVAFTDRSANAPTGWVWDFGDATSADAQSPAHAFARAGTYAVTLSAGNVNGTGTITKQVVVLDPPSGGAAACVSSPTTLCLNGGRFSVTATYRTTDGRTGNGTGVALTSDSGYFWFFSAANIEVVLKVLNACSQAPPRYWVFAAGLTNVEVTMTVTDTLTGVQVPPYVNPLGTPFQPIQDTNAFSTCP
ncbi:MAG TPA: PKD domain-containing protein, partial [Thermoanaerobaculia bacterium]|nr:PKD domain-containing protein [Thermoanaerobaculia bacterium]